MADKARNNAGGSGRRGPLPLALGGQRWPNQWQPGQSGNPSGRPKKGPEMKHLEQLCRESADVAFEYIRGLIRDPDAAPSVRLAAARELLDRGFGKAVDRTAIMALSGGGAEEPERLSDGELLRIAAGAGREWYHGQGQVLEFTGKTAVDIDEVPPAST